MCSPISQYSMRRGPIFQQFSRETVFATCAQQRLAISQTDTSNYHDQQYFHIKSWGTAKRITWYVRKDSDQSAHTRSLIRVFTRLSVGSQVPNDYSYGEQILKEIL